MKKQKTCTIIFWVVTLWLAVTMLLSGITQLSGSDAVVEMMGHLGYPVYFLSILGVWKIAGVIAILVPRFPVVKEWAYTGFFLAMSGGIFSHMAVGDGFSDWFPALLTLILIVVSYKLRPASRKVDCTC